MSTNISSTGRMRGARTCLLSRTSVFLTRCRCVSGPSATTSPTHRTSNLQTRASPAGSSHFLGTQVLIEFVVREVSEFAIRLAQRDSLLVCRLRELRGFVVADVRIERGHEHQALVH